MGGDHPRGIYSTAFDGPDGNDVLVGVGAEGRCLIRAHVPPEAERRPVIVAMQKLLNRLDPPSPDLRLV